MQNLPKLTKNHVWRLILARCVVWRKLFEFPGQDAIVRCQTMVGSKIDTLCRTQDDKDWHWTLGTSVSQNKTHIYYIHNNLTHPHWNGKKYLQLLDTILKTSGIPRWVQLHEVCSGKALFCCALYQRHRPIFQKIQIWATFVTFKPLKNFTVKQLSLPRFLYYRWFQITHHSAECLRFWI